MIPLLPLKLEHAIREVAAQFERRRRLQGRLIFGAVFLGLLIGLCAVVVFVDRVPVIVPVLTFFILVVGAGYKWLYVPQRTVVTREQIALFLDAHHPDLEDLIVSSVSLHGSTPVSEWMTDQVFQQVRELSAIQAPPVIDLRVLKRVRRAVVGVWGLGAVVLLVALWQVDLGDISGRLFSAPILPLPYTVEPGDARVRRGASDGVGDDRSHRGEQGDSVADIGWRLANCAFRAWRDWRCVCPSIARFVCRYRISGAGWVLSFRCIYIFGVDAARSRVDWAFVSLSRLFGDGGPRGTLWGRYYGLLKARRWWCR